MSDDLTARVQYNDLTGTVALDGFMGSPLANLAKLAGLPAHFVPVGFSANLIRPGENPLLSVSILAIDSTWVGDRSAFVDEHGFLPVETFTIQVDAATLVGDFKRVAIVALDGSFSKYRDKLRVEGD